MGEAGIAGDAFGQPHAVRHRQIFKKFLRALVRVEQAHLQVKHRLARHAEQEMPRLDDAGMHRAHRHLEHAFAFHLAELVPLAGERRQLRAQIEILAQRKDFRPVVVQGATAGVGMADEFQAEQVLDFPLLPVDGRDGVGQRGELRFVRRHGHAQDEKGVDRVERKHIVQVEGLFLLADVVGENTHQPRIPYFIKMGGEAGDQFHLGVKINFVGPVGAHGVEPVAETFLHFGHDFGHAG